LVNGDDGLFKGDVDVYNRWKTIANWVGLAPSIGKVYLSREFCVINSQLFYRKPSGLISLSHYMNPAGLLQFDARTYSKPVKPLDLKASNELFLNQNIQGRCFNEDFWGRCEELWYKTFDGILKTDWVNQYSIGWHIPQAFGGLGLRPRKGRETETLSRVQLARARMCLDQGSCFVNKPKERLTKSLDNPWKNTCNNRLVIKDIFDQETDTNGISIKTKVADLLKYNGRIDLMGEEDKNYGNFYIEKSVKSLNSVGLALVNGVSVLHASKCLEEKKFDFSRLNALTKKKENQIYFGYFRDITLDEISCFSIESIDSKEKKPWSPMIPDCQPNHIFKNPYSSYLEYIQHRRDEL
jgi:hypothetical protein